MTLKVTDNQYSRLSYRQLGFLLKHTTTALLPSFSRTIQIHNFVFPL